MLVIHEWASSEKILLSGFLRVGFCFYFMNNIQRGRWCGVSTATSIPLCCFVFSNCCSLSLDFNCLKRLKGKTYKLPSQLKSIKLYFPFVNCWSWTTLLLTSSPFPVNHKTTLDCHSNLSFSTTECSAYKPNKKQNKNFQFKKKSVLKISK